MYGNILKRILIIATTIIEITSIGNFTFEDRSYASSEIDHYFEQGMVTGYFKSLMKKYKAQKKVYQENLQTVRESNRSTEILGFICACTLIRERNHDIYQDARKQYKGSCYSTWNAFITNSHNLVAVELRGKLNSTMNFFDENVYLKCALALCDAFDVCSAHIHDDKKSVRVLSQFRKGSQKTLLEMLEDEDFEYLLHLSAMEYVNMFLSAAGEEPFPCLVFKRQGYFFAVPTMRSPDDMKICGYQFRHIG